MTNRPEPPDRLAIAVSYDYNRTAAMVVDESIAECQTSP